MSRLTFHEVVETTHGHWKEWYRLITIDDLNSITLHDSAEGLAALVPHKVTGLLFALTDFSNDMRNSSASIASKSSRAAPMKIPSGAQHRYFSIGNVRFDPIRVRSIINHRLPLFRAQQASWHFHRSWRLL